MWMRRGCNRVLGFCLAIGFGAISAGRADAGFTDSASPSPTVAADAAESPGPRLDLTPRYPVADLQIEGPSNASRSATRLDLPDAHDFRTGQKADDHLVARLTGAAEKGKSSYSLFWDDPDHASVERGIGDFGVEMKSASPVVVPLPAGVWAGLAVLGGIAVHQIRRHRKQLA